MELRDIEYFVAIASERSMRAAALKLGLTQPALTKAIRRLEDSVGVPLFDRGARGVSLTVYGDALLRHARTLKAGMAEVASELEALKDGTAGLVRIGAGPRWQQWVLPEAIRRFRETHPNVQLAILGGTDDVIKEQLSEGALDFIIASIPADMDRPDLLGEAITLDDYRVVADLDHPLRRHPSPQIADLLDYPWVLPHAATYLMQRVQAVFRAHGLTPPKPMIETDLPQLRFRLMRDCQTLLSVHLMGQLMAFREDRIRPIDIPGTDWQRPSGIITRRGVEPNPAAVALARLVQELCAAEPAAFQAKPTGTEPAGRMASVA